VGELFSEHTFIYVVLFLVPGFLARWTWASIVVAPEANEKTSFLSALIASAWLYAPLSPLIYWAIWISKMPANRPKAFAAWLFVVVFVWPIIAGLAIGQIRMTGLWRRVMGWLGVRSPEPRAWDTFFARREPCFVRATFEDGAMIGGLFYGDGSAASCYPADEDLLLEVLYELDRETGAFLRPVPGSKGGWIDMENVRHLEFLAIELNKENADGAKENGVPPAEQSAKEPAASTGGA
jgi:hypothetical protein